MYGGCRGTWVKACELWCNNYNTLIFENGEREGSIVHSKKG